MELGGIVIIIICVIIGLILGSIYLLAVWKTFKKMCGRGWVVLIPIYGTYVLNTKILKRSSWLILIDIMAWINVILNMINKTNLLLEYTIYLIAFLYQIFLENGISKGFRKGKWFTCGLVFLPVIFYSVLAFSNDKFYKEIFEKNRR